MADASRHTRKIMTSVALMRAAAVWPGLRPISRAELAVMTEVICWPPTEILISAISPLMRTRSMRPTNWFLPLTRAHGQDSVGACSTSGTKQEAIHLASRNSVMASCRFHAANLALINPLLDSGETDIKGRAPHRGASISRPVSLEDVEFWGSSAFGAKSYRQH